MTYLRETNAQHLTTVIRIEQQQLPPTIVRFNYVFTQPPPPPPVSSTRSSWWSQLLVLPLTLVKQFLQGFQHIPTTFEVLLLIVCFRRDFVKLLGPQSCSHRFSKPLTIFFATSSKNTDDRCECNAERNSNATCANHKKIRTHN